MDDRELASRLSSIESKLNELLMLEGYTEDENDTLQAPIENQVQETEVDGGRTPATNKPVKRRDD